MVLAIDIGNTHILLGCFEDRKILFTELLSTDRSYTDLEYASLIKSALEFNVASFEDIEGAIISSVVPSVTGTIKTAVERFANVSPIVVGPGVKTGLKIRIDNPAQLGSDLVVSAVAGIKEYGVPQINIYMGTATAFSLIDSEKNYLGTSIGAGMGIAAEALSSKTSQLPNIAFETPKKVIGTNTVDSMKSGLICQNAALIDGMIERIEEEYGEECVIVATGRYSSLVTPLCKHKIICDKELILKGLIEVYYKNC
ncbi:MAG: type III pantothenate kinase [Clostridiales bacterium]|jgi:type III pantothenate kinase|nr:type III pantothenate kinase [Clostridiales bacterium]MBQ2155111.1 type III pantothenate kinase [Clostridiales bacterium]